MYKQANSSYVIRLTDKAYVPLTPKNRDYRDYLSWLEGGNIPQLCDPPIGGVPAFLPEVKPETP